MNCFERTTKIDRINSPFDFDYHLNYYVIYPWIRKENQLIRIIEDETGKLFKVAISQKGSMHHPVLILKVSSKEKISDEDLEWVRNKISWCLGCEENVDEFICLIKQDPVLVAAMQNKWGRRNKSTPTLFEGMMNVICAQNIQFSRLYSMSYNLASMFGKKFELPDGIYYAFPTPEEICGLSLDEIKKSKVGYRAKIIKECACYLAEHKSEISDIYSWNDEAIKQFLTGIKGVGPYTANLVLSVAFRYPNKVHIDSFVKEILNTFYIKTENMDDKEIIDFCNKRWGKHAGWVISVLTTDTDEWASALGVNMSVKSGANIKHSKVNI